MIFPEFFAFQLRPHGTCHLRRLDRAWSKHRKILQHHPQIRIGLHQLGQIVQGAFAIAAIIVEKFDQRDLAIGIADHGLVLRIENLRALVVHGPLAGGDFLDFLAALKLVHRIAQHFGIGEQIFLDDRLDLGFLWFGKFRCCGQRPSKTGDCGNNRRGKQRHA